MPEAGAVAAWTELRSVDEPLVSFRHHWVFASDGAQLTSDSTLHFRTEGELRSSLDAAGFQVIDIRDAPDRPGLEWIFLALKPGEDDPDLD